ncbi:MAG: conjugal transfer protein TraC [Candidatus Nealsonbacteria bacterium CG_4_9_14_0_2_um_filter_37_38]|nr:MAG: conjugal transfer protein TraC [Candidatus Nealsonbacteria bacterium CG11_big_fil_rev_8_21_14_0_20_37_68]PIW91838.1 MAG: conjugal transfer protein TraC [Candidatus Nealsonbacteria bacterium CG_4_8_14_3_um_filter_37_23]PJC51410.1 MAG: conjugal transfer protein TraC [Candidatus Nealsonbacteria bacterium CG_4_9_14_0_2_um_filter_37_38]
MGLFKKKEKEIPEIYKQEPIGIRDIISPASIEVSSNFIKIGERFAKAFFIFSYPRYLSTGWFSPVINLDIPMDVSLFLHPFDTGLILKQLRKRVTEVQAEIMEREEKGLIRDPALETAYRDLEQLRDRLITAQERMFQLGVYITVYAKAPEELSDIETNLRSVLESRLVYLKPALYQQKLGFNSCAPYGLDQLQVYTAMNTAPLSSIFPFVSFDLSSNQGILYGINQHNSSLILFDRFSLENANLVCFGTSGGGKSYFIKLEILRSLMIGIDCIVIDPENEYRFLSDTVGGAFFNISLGSPSHVNPFDLPLPREDEQPEDVLRSNIMNLVGLLRIMLKELSPEEDAICDQALAETYASKDITPYSDPKTWKDNIPLMQDFESVLETMEGTESLVTRLKKFTKGTYANFFNQPSNITMENNFVVFGIRDMEDELRPAAMFIVMRYVWNTIRSRLKKRILVIDEAWWLMKTEDGASFLFGTVKRARKYWLGVTTITQDVIDFMKSDYGRPIITNSALQVLMKQSPAMIEMVKKTFNLTDEEKNILLETPIGEGLFFAGLKHVLMRVMASYTEDQFITTSPEEVVKIKKAKGAL